MYIRQPRYFKDFKCIGGACTSSCCFGWRIDWTKEEIDKVKNAPGCSEELKALCENTFKQNGEKYKVDLAENGGCPFLTEDFFCRIQRELGEEYLSHTCTIYPRHYVAFTPVTYRYCNMSCPEVMKKLLSDDKSTDLVNVQLNKVFTVKNILVLNTPNRIKEHPERKHGEEIFEFFYETISNKKLPLESCIILGALAAQSLTKLVGAGEYDRIPEAIKTLRAQMHNGTQLKSIENIKPNYNVKLGVVDKLVREFFPAILLDSLIDGDGIANIDLYRRGEFFLEKQFEDRMFAWRNLALNLMLELITPFQPEENTIFENYSVFVIAYAFLRHSALAVVEADDRTGSNTDLEKIILRFSTAISRSLCHSPKNLKKLTQRLKDFKITSPAYLARVVK